MNRGVCVAVSALASVVFGLPAVAIAGGRATIARPATRIVGGKGSSVLHAPWQVAVERAPETVPGDGYRRQICGGTLVAPRLVITAAHCLVNGSGGFKPADLLTVVSGRTRLASTAGVESTLDTYVLFTDAQGAPLYDRKTSGWDVALLELSEPAIGLPIKLAGPDERSLWSPGRAAYISGWGALSASGPYPNRLRAAEIGVFADGRCDRVYADRWDSRTSMCAGTFLGRRDTCFGDSGGPLVAPTSTGEVRLIGNTQFGLTCGSPLSPGGYGRLAADPVRSALAQAAFELTGDLIVGSGGRPARALDPGQARELAWTYAEHRCRGRIGCRGYWAGRCRSRAGGFRCTAELYRHRHGRSTACEQRVSVSGVTGRLRERGRGKVRCRAAASSRRPTFIAKTVRR